MSQQDYRIKYNRSLYRFVVVDLEGNIIDKGSHKTGYRTPRAAHRGYAWRVKNLTFGSSRDFRLEVH